MNRVFVSYSRRNRNFAERLSRDLSDAGLDVWVDWRQIHAGEFWQEEIFRGIERADILVACLSPDAVKSEWCQREINTAYEKGKVILPVMAVEAFNELQQTPSLHWLTQRHWIHFEGRYQEAFQELLESLPGKRSVGAYDVIDVSQIPNPFKGLEAFQQTDAQFFFGREKLIEKSLDRLRVDRPIRFLGVVGASGSGKSSLVRAGIIPVLRRGEALPGSDEWRGVIFTPGESPVEALVQRMSPLIDNRETEEINAMLHRSVENIDLLIEESLMGTSFQVPPLASKGVPPPITTTTGMRPVSLPTRLLLVVDQFEEVFTRAGESERALFVKIIHRIVTVPGGKGMVLITMRADFFDRVGRYPELAEMFEQENMVIVTEMTSSELLRSIEGPAKAVGLVYDDGLPQRILEDVRRQPGSLPLLQYALKTLYERREGNRLTTAAYEAIGGVRRALATHAENVFLQLNVAQQAIMRRVLLRLIEVAEGGEATRRRVARSDLSFRDVPDAAVQELLDLLTSAESRLLIASREIKASSDETAPTIWIDVGHEALIREWDRFTGWVAENVENLRLGSELLQAARDWHQSGRDMAYLLTGNRLVRAELWLDSADATNLQREFIQASLEEHERLEAARQKQIERELALQRRAARILRYFVAVLVIALVVAVGLTFFALASLQRANASEQRAQEALVVADSARAAAEANAQEARSLALSASANRALADNDTDLAVMLAVYANQISNPPPQAQRVLSEVAYSPGTRRILTGHEGSVEDAVFSPDGRLALTASRGILYVWDVNEGAIVRRLTGHNGTVNSIALSPDGTRAASGGNDNLVMVWDVATGTESLRLAGHTDVVNSVAYSPDGRIIASASEDKLIIWWDAVMGVEIRRSTLHTEAVNSIAFSADGRYLLSGSDDGNAILWSAASGELVRILAGVTNNTIETYDFTAVAFDPTNAARAVTGGSDRIVRLWNLDTGVLIRSMDGHDNAITDVVYTPDGRTVVSASTDNTVIQWNISNGSRLATFKAHAASVWGVDVSADGARLLSASFDGTARLWDLTRSEEIQRYVGHTGAQSVVAVFGPNDETVVSGSYSDFSVRLWDRFSGLTIQEFRGHEGRISDVAISADGRRILSAAWDSKVILWDAATGQSIRVLEGHTGEAQAVRFLANDTQALSSSTNGGIILWNLDTGEIIRRFGPAVAKEDPGHFDPVYDLAVTPDGTRFVSASADDTLLLWDINTGTVLHEFVGHNADVRAVAFSADGRLAVSGAANGSVFLWDTDAASPTFGQVIQRFEGHDRTVFDVDFSPDGRSIVSGALDGTIRLWDLNSGFELRRYLTDRQDKTYIRSVDFSADGRILLTGMTDSTIREWRVLTDLNELIAWTFANRFVAEPTCDDRRLFEIQPPCDAQGIAPARTPFPQPTATPMPQVAQITIGGTARVNTDRGERLVLRAEPGLSGVELTRLDDAIVVHIVDGPVVADGLTWWRIRTDTGEEGWSVESVPTDGIRTLVPN